MKHKAIVLAKIIACIFVCAACLISAFGFVCEYYLNKGKQYEYTTHITAIIFCLYVTYKSSKYAYQLFIAIKKKYK